MNRYSCLACLAVGCLFSIGGIGCKPSDAKVQMFESAPDFALKDLEGKMVRLSDYKGKPILLSFWAVDCGACRAELPSLIELHKRYGDKGLTIVSVASWDHEPKNKVEKFVEQQKIPYTVLIQGGRVAGEQYHVQGVPSLVWIDRDFRIRERTVGFNAGEADRELAKMSDSAENLIGGS